MFWRLEWKLRTFQESWINVCWKMAVLESNIIWLKQLFLNSEFQWSWSNPQCYESRLNITKTINFYSWTGKGSDWGRLRINFGKEEGSNFVEVLTVDITTNTTCAGEGSDGGHFWKDHSEGSTGWNKARCRILDSLDILTVPRHFNCT